MKLQIKNISGIRQSIIATGDDLKANQVIEMDEKHARALVEKYPKYFRIEKDEPEARPESKPEAKPEAIQTSPLTEEKLTTIKNKVVKKRAAKRKLSKDL